MKLCLVIILLATACTGSRRAPAPAPAPAPTAAHARAAYDAKQYAACALEYSALAERSRHPAMHLHSAACCHALDGKPDLAFAALDRMLATGSQLHHIPGDTDFGSLHSDPRWARLITALEQRLAALTQPALRRELLERFQRDQAALKAAGYEYTDASKVVRSENNARMKEIIAAHGWPGKSMIGEDGAHAAWLLVQHADDEPAFQKQCLALMKPLVDAGEVTENNYAYLHDRIAVAEGRRQRYGTQFNKQREPQPIEDEANVDARRIAIGLPPMAEYKQQMLQMYGRPKSPAPAQRSK